MLIGRKEEQNILKTAVNDNKSRFIATYGRRRVGKTYLIRETFGGRFTFEHTGISDGDMKTQLEAFSNSLILAGHTPDKRFTNWLEAFFELKKLVLQSKEKRKIIFIDELSWMDTQKSGFISGLENFWNSFASARKDIVLIVCASATSWMLSKIIHNKGGLYNRLTDRIHLQQFSLKECEDYITEHKLTLNRSQIMQFYMIFGGVPFYWEYIQPGLSLPQNIDNILFSKNAPLKDEIKYLYSSVFKHPDLYIRIIETLAAKRVGMTREDIIKHGRMNNSGDLSTKLEELESCGFIKKYLAFGLKKKQAIYQLMDAFTLFHYQFLKDSPDDIHFWSNQINTPRINTWTGLAFERLCMNHTEQIKKKLGIQGVLTTINSWSCKKDLDKGLFGSQIDMLIVRKDQVINLCEMKYSGSEYTVTSSTDKSIRNKTNDLITATGTKYAIYPTLITPYGMVKNSYSGNIPCIVTMNDLFADIYSA